MKTSQTCYSVLSTIVGDYLLISEDDRIAGIYSCAGKYCPKPSEQWRRTNAGFRAAREQLTAYFAGDLREFELRLSPRGTPFQLRVWNLLSSIPYGTTTTYGELARKLGNSGASRSRCCARARARCRSRHDPRDREYEAFGPAGADLHPPQE